MTVGTSDNIAGVMVDAAQKSDGVLTACVRTPSATSHSPCDKKGEAISNDSSRHSLADRALVLSTLTGSASGRLSAAWYDAGLTSRVICRTI
jgi:hypothetical protein